jgi:hypothetical protein
MSAFQAASAGQGRYSRKRGGGEQELIDLVRLRHHLAGDEAGSLR